MVVRSIHKIESAHLSKEVEIAAYGHYGCAILMFPSTTDDYLENEKNGIIEGEQLTRDGDIARAPVFLPDGRLVYFA